MCKQSLFTQTFSPLFKLSNFYTGEKVFRFIILQQHKPFSTQLNQDGMACLYRIDLYWGFFSRIFSVNFVKITKPIIIEAAQMFPPPCLTIGFIKNLQIFHSFDVEHKSADCFRILRF